MSLIKTIRADQLAARKNKETIKASLLTTLIGEINNEFTKTPIVKRLSEEPTDTIVLAIIKKFIDNVEKTIQYIGNKDNTNNIEELTVLTSYLPTKLTTEEIKKIVNSLQFTNNFLGFTMKHFKENYNARYDALELKQIVDSVIKLRD